MRIKEFFWMLGFKPGLKKYGFSIQKFLLEKEGEINVAEWQHPKCADYIPTQAEVDALRKFLNPGDVCIDIGAHLGDTAIPMGLAVGKEGVVIALEPNSYVFETLKANSMLNMDKYNILPLCFAATPEDSEMVFEYSDPGFCNGGFHENISKWQHGHSFKLKVEGKNLVNYLQLKQENLIDRIRYIKIDAEGFDLTILKSLNYLVEKNRPFIRVEVFKKSNVEYRVNLFQYLKEKGYTIYKFIDSENYVGEELTVNDMMKYLHFDMFAIPVSREAVFF